MKNYKNINYEELISKRVYVKSCLNSFSNVYLQEYIVYKIDDLVKESYENMEYVGETIEKKAKEILVKYNFNKKYSNFYAYIMREIMRNVVEHSEAKELILMIYSNDLNDFGFKVIDNGIGIRKSLNINPNYDIVDDTTAIAFAIRPGITRSWRRDPLRDDAWQNSGFGLYMVSNIMNYLKGIFEITSGNSSLEYKDGFLNYRNNKIKGTEVTVVFDKSKDFNHFEITKKISRKGSEILKNAENTFAQYAEVETASKASTLIKY